MALTMTRCGQVVSATSDQEIREQYERWSQEREAKMEVAKAERSLRTSFRVVSDEDAKRSVDAAAQNRAVARLKSSGCPLRYLKALEAIKELPAWARVRDALCRRIGRGAIVGLLGNRGTGKTQIAVSVIEHACRTDRSGLYLTAIDLFRAIRASYSADGMSEEDVVRKLVRPDVLVIDECHQRGETAWEDRMLVNLLDRRYAELRLSILIANQTPDEFTAALGDSVADRTREDGALIVCDWPSFRNPA